jgi:hypothetical protein
MTSACNETVSTINRLIQSCQEAQNGFILASKAALDTDLKRLFSIYAHQRTRFADELRGHAPDAEVPSSDTRQSDWPMTARNTDCELLEYCVQADLQTLELYREAMKNGIPSKAAFVISAQFSLMQKVHERMNSLLQDRRSSGRPINVSVQRAAV